MIDYVLKYADTRGEVHNQITKGASEQEVRERFTRQGFLRRAGFVSTELWRAVFSPAFRTGEQTQVETAGLRIRFYTRTARRVSAPPAPPALPKGS